MSKIVLHYVWFKDYVYYKNTGINLSTKYTFRFDEKTMTVTIKKNPGYNDEIYGSNVDLSAIVGENGAGKTAFLRFLFELGSESLNNVRCVVIFEQESSMQCITNMSGSWREKGLDKLLNYGFQNIYDRSSELAKSPFNKGAVRFIYMTEMFSPGQFFENSSRIDDLSFASCLKGASEKKLRDNLNPVTQYIHNAFDWQMNFFANGEDFAKEFGISFPRYAEVAFLDLSDKYEKSFCKEGSDSDAEAANKAQKRFRQLSSIKDLDQITVFKFYLARAMFYQIMTEHISCLNQEEKGAIIKQINIIAEESENASAWDTLRKILYILSIEYSYPKNNSSVLCQIIDSEHYINFMNYIDDVLNRTVNFSDEKIKNINSIVTTNRFLVPVNDEYNMQGDLNTNIKDFYNFYKKTVCSADYLSFSWGLSSGETLLLGQFSKLMHLLTKDEAKDEAKEDSKKFYLPDSPQSNKFAQNAVILLDEAEVSYHPEWQRKFLKEFIKFIKETIVKKGTHVQVILATHSPIILSDIPKQNVVYLKRSVSGNSMITVAEPNETRQETFGASIYTLFNNSFFMEKGAIGAIALEYIEKIVNTIHAYDTKEPYPDGTQILLDSKGEPDLEKAQKNISLIGDEFVREQLNNMLMQAMKSQKRSYDDRLNELKNMQRYINEEIAFLEAGGERHDQN